MKERTRKPKWRLLTYLVLVVLILLLVNITLAGVRSLLPSPAAQERAAQQIQTATTMGHIGRVLAYALAILFLLAVGLGVWMLYHVARKFATGFGHKNGLLPMQKMTINGTTVWFDPQKAVSPITAFRDNSGELEVLQINSAEFVPAAQRDTTLATLAVQAQAAKKAPIMMGRGMGVRPRRQTDMIQLSTLRQPAPKPIPEEIVTGLLTEEGEISPDTMPQGEATI